MKNSPETPEVDPAVAEATEEDTKVGAETVPADFEEQFARIGITHLLEKKEG